ncbi:MAG: DoxX family protein [Myxococcales bacterium]|nr:DoxX family protein [Myxococcales bacterium]
MNALAQTYRKALHLLRRAEPLGPLAVRLCLGVLFAQSGWGKLHNLAGVTSFFESLGIPAPGLQAAFVGVVELVGGGALVLGLATRLASLLLSGTMVVAIATAQWKEFEGLAGFLTLAETVYLAGLVWLLVSGAGALALDALIVRWSALRGPAGSEAPARAMAAKAQ